MKLKWKNYFLAKGEEVDRFWISHSMGDKRRRILLLLGVGIDPRCCDGLKMLRRTVITNDVNYILFEIDEGLNSPTGEYESWARANLDEMKNLIPAELLRKETINIFDSNNRRIGSKEIIKILRSPEMVDFQDLTDIILDVSALPRHIFFSFITEILNQIDENRLNTNLHILVSENSKIDVMIKNRILDDNISFFPGFAKNTSMQSLEDVPRIWIPILGEDRLEEISRLYRGLNLPQEVCPMLPFPAKNPRRCDDLIREYHKFLFDVARVEPGNFIYAGENNPFDVYRQIIYTSTRYNKSLKLLGGAVIIISPLSSKIMTIGAAMAAYELRKDGINVDVSYVGARGYEVSGDQSSLANTAKKSQLNSVWLAGECYD